MGAGLLWQSRERFLEVGDGELLTLAERDGSDNERLGPVRIGHAEADGEVNRGDGPERVANGCRRERAVLGADQRRDRVEEPEVAVRVLAEEVAGRDPRVVGPEDSAKGRLGRRVHVGVDLGDQDADLVRVALAREPVVRGLELAALQVERGDPHAGGARQRAAHRADLLAGDVRKDHLALGRGVELDDPGGREAVDDAGPEPLRHARAHEQADGMVALVRVGRSLDQVAEHRPRVGADRDAVAAHLVPERRGVEVARHRDPRAARDRAAEAHHEAGRVIDGRDRIDGVRFGQRRGCRGAERREDPAPVRDAVGTRAVARAGEENEGEVARPAGVRLVPAGELHLVRVDPLHVDHSAAEVARPGATTQDQDLHAGLPGLGHVLGVGDDACDLAKLRLALDLAVGAKENAHGAQAVERGDDGERGRPRLHQDAHVLALVDADRDQAPDDRVDAVLGRGVGVGAVLEEEEDLLGVVVSLLVEELPERDPRARPHLVEADQARQLGERLRADRAHAGRGAGGAGENERARFEATPAGEREAVAGARGRARSAFSSSLDCLDAADGVGQLSVGVAPARPAGNRRPGGRGRCRSDDEAEVTGAKRELVDLGARGGADDRPHRGRRGDLVHLADDGEDRALDVGQGDQPLVDHESAIEHSVVGDELLQEVGERGTGPSDPAVGLEELALSLARQKRVAVVELADEVELLAGGLDGVEHAEARAGHPCGNGCAGKRADGEDVGDASRDILGDAQWHGGGGVDRAAEGDEARKALAPAKRRRLVAEHPALAVAAEVRILAGRLAHAGRRRRRRPGRGR